METGWSGVPAGGGAASDVAGESQSTAIYVAGPPAAEHQDLRCGRRSQLSFQRAGLPWGPGELASQMPIGGSEGGTRKRALSFLSEPGPPRGSGHQPRPAPPRRRRLSPKRHSRSALMPPPLSTCSDPHLQALPCCLFRVPTPATALSVIQPDPSVGTRAPSPQVDDIQTPRLAGSVQPEALKFSHRFGQSSVSRGFILTYMTGHKRAGSAGCTEKGRLGPSTPLHHTEDPGKRKRA